MTTHFLSVPEAETLTEFPFFDDAAVRTGLSADGNVWFCARDVAAVLGMNWSGHLLKGIPEEWTSMVRSTTQHGVREVQIINEPALYRLIFRSQKPKALEFANWVCGTVLPAIRKHGAFGALTAKDEVSMRRTLAAHIKQLDDTKDAFAAKLLIGSIRRLCQMLHEPMPDVGLIGSPVGQLKLGQS